MSAPQRKVRTRQPIPVQVESEKSEVMQLELDLGSQDHPRNFIFSAPVKIFRTELDYLKLTLPDLIQRIVGEEEFEEGEEQVVFKAGNYTATVGDSVIIVDTSMGDVVISLPSATHSGKRFIIVKETSDVDTVSITPFGNDTIEASNSKTLSTQWQKAILKADGVSNWLDLGTNQV